MTHSTKKRENVVHATIPSPKKRACTIPVKCGAWVRCFGGAKQTGKKNRSDNRTHDHAPAGDKKHTATRLRPNDPLTPKIQTPSTHTLWRDRKPNTHLRRWGAWRGGKQPTRPCPAAMKKKRPPSPKKRRRPQKHSGGASHLVEKKKTPHIKHPKTPFTAPAKMGGKNTNRKQTPPQSHYGADRSRRRSSRHMKGTNADPS